MSIPSLRQMWFLDDGACYGKADVVKDAFHHMKAKLASIGLKVNIRKCEIYGPKSEEPLPGFDNVPVIVNRNAWTYLGTPLCEQTFEAFKTPLARISQATNAIANFATAYPSQALQLLRITAGACKVEFLIQSLTSSHLVNDLAGQCSTQLRKAFCAVLQTPDVDDATWALATLPLRKGGLGLRDPKTIIQSARLASIINTTERAKGFGADAAHMSWETERPLVSI